MSAVAEIDQPISGVSPPELQETTIMTIWPSIAGSGFGKFLGRLYQIRAGIWPVTIGNLIALISIPAVLPLILNRFFVTFIADLPVPLFDVKVKDIPLLGIPIQLLANMEVHIVRRYVITNRRVLIAEGLLAKPTQYVELDRFDTIDVVIQPGQEWYPAGDLIFYKGKAEAFRLTGVRRPETFRQVCMKARNGYVGVKKAMG
jgi:hypothetical protein